jgi:hypothetical protein
LTVNTNDFHFLCRAIASYGDRRNEATRQNPAMSVVKSEQGEIMQTTSELTIPIHHTIYEILYAVGEPETITLNALRRYLLDICWQKIEQIEKQIKNYEQQYGLSYEFFNQSITTDEQFLDNINQQYPMWESDAIEWLYRIEEVHTWEKRLEQILRVSSASLMKS